MALYLCDRHAVREGMPNLPGFAYIAIEHLTRCKLLTQQFRRESPIPLCTPLLGKPHS